MYQNVKIESCRGYSNIQYLVRADSARFGENEIVFQGHNMASCMDFLAQYGLSSKDVVNAGKAPDDAFIDEEIRETVKEAYKAIYNRCHIILPEIRFEYDEPYCRSSRCAGIYRGMNAEGIHNISLRYADGEDFYHNISNAVHEIGHVLHSHYFFDVSYRLGSDGKNNYAKKNGFENFAEGFKSYIMNGIDCDRSLQMAKILSGISMDKISFEPTPKYAKALEKRKQQYKSDSKRIQQPVR